jgi:hypothetical protein
MRRFVWRLMYPFACVANRWAGLSYKWVNVSVAAWHREWFDPLWHHEWFGDPIPALPDYVVLCGIGHRTSVSDGLVQFINDDMGGRIAFERDPHDPHSHLWYVTTTRPTSAGQVDQAYRWVRAVFGGSFEKKRAA